MQVLKHFGSPGTGKTTTLLKFVMHELSLGTKIDEIGFVGYTRAACNEALTRARKLIGFDKKERYWFMTLHATCLKLMRSKGVYDKVADFKTKKDFCYLHGLRFSNDERSSIIADKISDGTAFFSMYGWLANTRTQPENYEACPFYEDFKGSWQKRDYMKYHVLWKKFKNDNALMDFTDMIAWAPGLKLRHPADVLIVDEFQDLSPLQLDIIIQFMKNEKKKRVYIAGDDDQALYRFQGAEPEGLLNFGSDKDYVLEQSYRCPKEIFSYATTFIEKNIVRMHKTVKPRPGEGRMICLNAPRLAELMRWRVGSTYILLRANYLVSKLAWQLISAGIPFKYLDGGKERYLGWTRKKTSLLKKVLNEPMYLRREKLEELRVTKKLGRGMISFLGGYINRSKMIDPKEINIHIGTIHSSKGREADTIILCDDVPQRVITGMHTLPTGVEDERRVWYVGMTRARNLLILVSGMFPDLPINTYSLVTKLEIKK